MTDIFEVQDEIAGAIAAKFEVAAADRAPVRRGTANLEAYELFLKGRALQYRRIGWGSLWTRRRCRGDRSPPLFDHPLGYWV